MKKFTALLACLVWTSGPNFALATDPAKDCIPSKVRQGLLALSPVIHQFEDPLALPLSPDFIRVLESHPIYEWAKKYREKRVVVDIGYYMETTSGEAIQARFVIQVLKHLLNRLELKSRKDLTLSELVAVTRYGVGIEDLLYVYPNLKEEYRALGGRVDPPQYPVMQVFILDSAEVYSNKEKIPKSGSVKRDQMGRVLGNLDMPLIKPANSTVGGINHTQVRQSFGIPPDARVVSIYTVDRGDTAILDNLSQGALPDVIFYSDNRSTEVSEITQRVGKWTRRNAYRMVGLSHLRPGDLRDSKSNRVLVINDLRGVMPYQHAAADLAIVRGPINIFESLNVGTPTVVYTLGATPGTNEAWYHAETYQNMVQTALRTGGARHVTDAQTAGATIADAMKLGRGFTRPYLVRGEDGKTPVDRFLDHLMQVIVEEQGL